MDLDTNIDIDCKSKDSCLTEFKCSIKFETNTEWSRKEISSLFDKHETKNIDVKLKLESVTSDNNDVHIVLHIKKQTQCNMKVENE